MSLVVKKAYKDKNKLLIMTPSQALSILRSGQLKNAVLESIFIDKIDMHIALEQGGDLVEIGNHY